MFAAIQNQKIIYCVENESLCEALARGFDGIEEFRAWEAALPADDWGRPIKPAAAFEIRSLSGDLLERYRELERAGYRPGEIVLRDGRSPASETDPEALELPDPAAATDRPERELIADEKALARRQNREAWRALREKRNRLLDESDKYLIPDYPIGEARRAQWRDYRARLRDLTRDLADPADVSWPLPPAS